jgi:hypothetical protein
MKIHIIINKQLAAAPGVKFINMMNYICPKKDKCLALTDDNKPVFYDPPHLTKFGAKYLAEKIMPQIQ